MSEAPSRGAPPFTEVEIAHAIHYLRHHKEFFELIPPPGEIKVDWFLMVVIAAAVHARRLEQPNAKLQVLVGSVVREFIPDTTPQRRRLGMAYRNGIMKMLSDRAVLQNELKRSPAKRAHKRSKNFLEQNGQTRLL